MRHRWVFSVGLLSILIVSAGCDRPLDFGFSDNPATQEAATLSGGATAPATSAASQGGTVKDYASLVNALKSAGASVEPGDDVEQPFFSVTGRIIKVNGQDVQVFEYPDAASADGEAAQVSPDGGSVGTTTMMWVAPPHFYKAGRVIVLYVGSDSSVLSALRSVLGPQFAGR